MKKFRNRNTPRGKDRGSAIAEILVGVAIGIIVLGGGAMFFANVNKTNAGNAALQSKNTSISEALDRASQQVQVAGTILTAAPNELVIQAKESDTGELIINRWVKSGTTFYQQTWSGAANAYPFSATSWIPVSTAGAAAPNGDGKQVTRQSVTDLKSDSAEIFTYYGADGNELADSPALSAKDGGTNDIKRVAFHLKASVGDAGLAENTTSAALRNVTGGVSDGVAASPVCPVLSFDDRDEDQPVLRWSTVPGFTNYVIYRNASAAANVTVAAGKTVGEWTDTSKPAAAGDAVTYTVYAKSADGTLSSGCRPAVWRAQIAPAQWKATEVLPTSAEAAGWSAGIHAGLTTPRITVSWDPVAGASGYQLFYREVNAATGAEIAGKSGFIDAPGYDPVAGKTSFTWDGGGWGKRYEWQVLSTALSGQSEKSTFIQTLTHPAAPKNPTVKPEYGTGADKNTKGKNVMTWAASPTATSYEVWRYANKKSTGTATKVTSTTSRSFTDIVDYGTEFTYYVVAKNEGPRGVGADQAPVTGTRSSPTPESSVLSTDLPRKITQLQYPPIPEMVPVGPSGTRDNQGSNHIMWKSADSATGYLLAKATAGGTVTCLVKDCTEASYEGIMANSYTDNVPAGSQFRYYAKAYNATGLSVEFSAKETVTQRPATPVLQVSKKPDLATPNASFTMKANGDAGNADSDAFCTATSCSYQLLRNGTEFDSAKGEPAAADVSWNNIPNAEGATINYTAKSRNAALTNGGWSDLASQTVNTYPGQFSVTEWNGDAKNARAERFNLDLRNIEIAGSSYPTVQNGYSSVRWGVSPGASSFDLKRVSLANDSVGTSKGLPAATNLTKKVTSGGGGTWEELAAPGATYKYEVTATAPNGLKRAMTDRASFTTPADMSREGKQIVVCSTAGSNSPQLVAARLIDFQQQPRYGAWKSVTVRGLDHISADSRGWVESSLTSLGASGSKEILSGNGTPYYKGLTYGHDVWTVGNGGPDSARLRLILVSLAPQGIGCGPVGSTGNSMQEPVYPCYGYRDGTTCAAVNDQNRPRWVTN